jgi:hypothetical protein
MRNIRKTMKVKEVEVRFYDTKDKLEKLIETTVSEVESGVQLPEGCVMISEKVLSEKEVTYKMTPQNFVKHATIEK